MDSTSSTSANPTWKSSGSSSSHRYKASPRVAVVLLAIAALLAPIALAAESPAGAGDSKAPYALITTDGHRIDVMEKPAQEKDRVRMRLFPGGQPAIYPAKMIDWQATEKFNLLPPPPKPAAAAVTEPLVTPTVARASAGEVTRTGGILELKMIGGGHATATAAGEPGDAQAGAAASGAKPADPNATASIVASLTRELADLRGVQASMAESKSKVESDLAAAQARAAKDAPQGVSNYQSPAQQAIEQSNAALKDLNEHLATVEKRIGAIRDRLIELGAPIN